MPKQLTAAVLALVLFFTAASAFPGKRLFGKVKDAIAKKRRADKIRKETTTAPGDNAAPAITADETGDNAAPAVTSDETCSDSNYDYPPGALPLLQEATVLFQEAFGVAPSFAAHAPGRVNLIGEHTDYTGGFVLPLALEKRTVIVGTGAVVDVGSPNSMSTIHSTQGSRGGRGRGVTFDADPSLLAPGDPFWANYVKGVVAVYSKSLPAGKKYTFNAVFASDVPLGAGLSSSAALEVSTATFLEGLPGAAPVSKEAKAVRCQKAEHEYCGVPCGVMDQFISSLGEEGKLLQIDCRSHVGTAVTMGAGDAVILVTNSNVKHALSGSEYPARVAQCKAATDVIRSMPGNSEVAQLRDATPAMLEAAHAQDRGVESRGSEEPNPILDDEAYRRARHVISENGRVLAASAALEAGDFDAVGTAMLASHASLKDDFQVSCPELDTLVALAANYEGVYGSRMTGGGFGGCIVTLVKASAADGLIAHLKEGYYQATKLSADSFVTRPGMGAGALKPLC